MNNLNGIYKGFSATDESGVALGELEVVLSDKVPRSLLREMSGDEVTDLFQPGEDIGTVTAHILGDAVYSQAGRGWVLRQGARRTRKGAGWPRSCTLYRQRWSTRLVRRDQGHAPTAFFSSEMGCPRGILISEQNSSTPTPLRPANIDLIPFLCYYFYIMTQSESLNFTEGSNISFVHLSQKRDGSIVPSERDNDAEKSFIEQSYLIRTSLDELPINTDGLDLDRLNAFFKQIGACAKPLFFLEPPHFNKALEITGSKSREPSGIYFEALGISLVQRDLGLEAINGVALTESFAIHEAAHSTHIVSPIRLVHSKKGIWRTPTTTAIPTKSSYGITVQDSLSPHYGELFEEGYAEFERGMYVQANNLTEQFTRDSVDYAKFKNFPIPLHYMYKIAPTELEGASSLTFAPGALAATIFEILSKRDDEFTSILRKSRQNSDGSKELAESIDHLVPGLHSELQQAKDQFQMASLLKEVLNT
jgi:hypothetical protein